MSATPTVVALIPTHLEALHYYPFGMVMQGPWMDDVAARNMPYQYNGKELNEDFGLGLSDYGARWYDASLGRWWSVDPMAEQYHQWSGYCYVMDNPLSFVDLDGMSASSGQHNHLPKGEDPLEVKCPECLKQGEMIPGTDQTASTDEVPIDGGKGGVPESTKPAEEFQRARAVDLLSQEIGRIQRDAYMQIRPMASGALSTLDGFNDPIFFALTSGFVPGLMRGAGSVAVEGGEQLLLESTQLGSVVAEQGLARLSTLNPTHYILKSESAMKRFVSSVKSDGVIHESILFVENNGSKYIVDGHHRFFAAQKLGIQHVPVQQTQLPFRGYKTAEDLILSGKQPVWWKFYQP